MRALSVNLASNLKCLRAKSNNSGLASAKEQVTLSGWATAFFGFFIGLCCFFLYYPSRLSPLLSVSYATPNKKLKLLTFS
jgi:hypothetical protein